jgi:isoleucyl-tRNA synthetase
MDVFELTKVVREIQEFIIEDLSNWYIRRCRRRFWSTDLDEDKKAVYNTTYEVLVGICKIIAPFVPFISEELYRNLTGEESVHLALYPEVNDMLINKEIEDRMDLVRNLVGLGRASRESAKIKVRQPLREVLIDGKYEEKISDLIPLIKEELNVKEVIFENDLSQFMNFSLKPNFKIAGSILGSKIKSFGKVLNELNAKETVEKLENGETLTLNLNGEDTTIEKDYVLVTISSKEGFNVTMENNLFVILDTTLTPDLIKEGYAREFVSKIQQMRKNNGYEVLDNINIFYNGSDEIKSAIDEFEEIIKKETLAQSIERVNEEGLEEQDLNGQMTGIRLERI